jgi:hypothetical protein
MSRAREQAVVASFSIATLVPTAGQVACRVNTCAGVTNVMFARVRAPRAEYDQFKVWIQLKVSYNRGGRQELWH